MDISPLIVILEHVDIPASDRMLVFLKHADSDVLDRYAARVRREYPKVDSAIGICPHVYADAQTVTDVYLDTHIDRWTVTAKCEPFLRAEHRDAVIASAIASGYAELVTVAILSLYSVMESRQYRARCERERAMHADSADS